MRMNASGLGLYRDRVLQKKKKKEKTETEQKKVDATQTISFDGSHEGKQRENLSKLAMLGYRERHRETRGFLVFPNRRTVYFYEIG